MSSAAYERLKAMREGDEITTEEYELAKKYLREELAELEQARAASSRVEDTKVQVSDERMRRYRAQSLPGLLITLGLAALTVAHTAPTVIEEVEPRTALFAFLSAIGFIGFTRMFARLKLIRSCVVGLGIFLLGVSGPLWPDDSSEASKQRRRVASLTALEKMEIAFQGGYSRDQIAPILHATMRQFGSVPTEAKRTHWSDVLVVLRKDSGVPEMEILRCMRAMGPQQIKFDAAAAICATTLDAM